MSEEEKKAIELLKNKNTEYYYRFIDVRDAVNTLLNLTEKQQKEIEEMREELQIYVDVQNNDIHNYISKDKIRERIKEARKIRWHIPELVIEYFEEFL